MVTRFHGYRFRVFKETRIRVRVSSQIGVKILIPKTSLPKGLLGQGCSFDHQPHLHYHLREILQISNVNITRVGHEGHVWCLQGTPSISKGKLHHQI
jgi:hypothetical protein